MFRFLRPGVLLFSVLTVLSSRGLANSIEDYEGEWGGSISLTAVAGKAFGVNLVEYTKTKGKFSLVLSPKWTQLAESGVLYGTPQKSDVGDAEIFFSVAQNGKENNFRVLLTVAEAPPIPKIEYELAPNEVFKVDLREASGMRGKFEYTGLPKWMHGLESGVVVGMPIETDAGMSMFVVRVLTESTTETFQVKLTVKKGPPNSPADPNPRPTENETINSKPITVRWGEFFSINLKEMMQWEGIYSVNHSDWLNYSTDGTLSGTPQASNIGIHTVYINVDNNGVKQQAWFRISVEKR